MRPLSDVMQEMFEPEADAAARCVRSASVMYRIALVHFPAPDDRFAKAVADLEEASRVAARLLTPWLTTHTLDNVIRRRCLREATLAAVRWAGAESEDPNGPGVELHWAELRLAAVVAAAEDQLLKGDAGY